MKPFETIIFAANAIRCMDRSAVLLSNSRKPWSKVSDQQDYRYQKYNWKKPEYQHHAVNLLRSHIHHTKYANCGKSEKHLTFEAGFLSSPASSKTQDIRL
jgi:hypothetical protein